MSLQWNRIAKALVPDRSRSDRSRRVLSLAIILAAVAATFIAVSPGEGRAQTTPADPQACKQFVPTTPEQEVGDGGLEARVRLKATDDDQRDMEFGQSREPLRGEVEITLSDPPDPGVIESPVVVTVKMAEPESAVLKLNAVLESSEMSGDGERIKIGLCIDPEKPGELDAGTYIVRVRVDDPRFGPQEIALNVTLQSGWTWLFLLASVLFAAGAGAFAIVIAILQQGFSRTALKSGVDQIFIVVAAIFGGFLGWQAFEKTVAQDPAWRGGRAGFLVLILAAMTAGYSISVLVTLFRATRQTSPDKVPVTQATDGEASPPDPADGDAQ